MIASLLVTVKVTPLLATPPTVTTTGPVVALTGTGAVMLVAVQLLGVVVTPLKVTVLVPCVDPKLVPLIVTAVPTGPEVTERPLMLGGADTTTVVVDAVQLLVSLDSLTTARSSAQAPRKYVPGVTPPGILTETLPLELFPAPKLGMDRVPVSNVSVPVMVLSSERR